jgi:protoporphyrinogen oxidase
MSAKTAIIIGAGPAGLTAAYELLHKTDIIPIVYEMSGDIGGISKTVHYKGNRMDIGGHRFFSKSDVVMDWWKNIMPLQGALSKDDLKLNNNAKKSKLTPNGPDPEKEDIVMLIRSRLSRIFYLRHFFDYPISLNFNTIKNLGFSRIMKIGFSYLYVKFFPVKNETSLEDFFINRFGHELYRTFFKDYTEKVWGAPCRQIQADWGAQRIKGLSITKALLHALKNMFSRENSIEQKKTETTLIEQFMYPKFGPGQLWEQVAAIIENKGGKVLLNHKITALKKENGNIESVSVKDEKTGEISTVMGDYFFSTMPVQELIQAMDGDVPQNVREVAAGLVYRDFITVGLLLDKLKIRNNTQLKTVNDIVPDNWIYIQESDVKIGRLQIFNNWSPYMVKDENKVWMGLEYFCSEGDELWEKPDDEFAKFAAEELAKIDIIHPEDVLDSTVIRVPKTYPAYFGSYDRFNEIAEYTDQIKNLFLIGRNGMHRYNNQDHSMLTAITAVENIMNNVQSKKNIWAVNVEEEYHEEK